MEYLNLHEPLPEAERSQRIFAGNLLVFRQLPALLTLCQRLDERLRAAFGGDPRRAEQWLDGDDYRQRWRTLSRAMERDGAVQALLHEALQQTGVDLAGCYWDRLCLRVVPCDAGRAGYRRATRPHRDTWGSALHAQTNWWTPLYPLNPRHTLAFYPRYWQEAIANTSGDWSFEELLAHRRRGEDYPSAPTPQTTPDDDPIPVIIEPGDLLCFSGAHLHTTIPNSAGTARFSIETRTVHDSDLQKGRAAANVDCDPQRQPHWEWFRHIVDGMPLEEPAG